MEAFSIIKDKQKRAVWLRAFRIWQRKPHEVAPLSTESHECNSCGTTFTGNYCPRCGQSARIGRFSFKKAFLLFLDVWGLGNRGMFRSLRDLLLRPGYMIRDYISGKQSAYFPPFKMFFLLATLSLFVEHGPSFGLEGKKEDTKKDYTTEVQESKTDAKFAKTKQVVKILVNDMNQLHEKNSAIFSLLTLLIFSLPMFLLFRKTPNIPNLRYSEFVVALVYTSNMYSLYSITGKILGTSILEIIATVMFIVALSQFSDFSKLRVVGKLILTAIIFLFAIVASFLAAISIIYCFS